MAYFEKMLFLLEVEPKLVSFFNRPWVEFLALIDRFALIGLYII